MRYLILALLLTTNFLSFAIEEDTEVNKEGWTQAYDFEYRDGVRYNNHYESITTSGLTGVSAVALAVANQPIAGLSLSSYGHCALLYIKAKDNGFAEKQLSDTSAYFEFMTSCFIKTPLLPATTAADMMSTLYDEGPVATVRDFSTDATKGTSSGLDGYADVLAATQQEALEQLAAVVEGIDSEMPMATALIDHYISIHNVEATREDVALFILDNV